MPSENGRFLVGQPLSEPFRIDVSHWPRRDSNPYIPCGIRDFKSRASTDSATRPVRLAVVEAAVGGRLLLGRRYYRILDGCWLPLPTEAMRLMAFKNALALASMLSVETPWPRYSSP